MTTDGAAAGHPEDASDLEAELVGDAAEEVPADLWCEECHRLVVPSEVTEDNRCPRCSNELMVAEEGHRTRRRVPWTFKAMIVATVIYLGYRAYQGVGWAIHHL